MSDLRWSGDLKSRSDGVIDVLHRLSPYIKWVALLVILAEVVLVRGGLVSLENAAVTVIAIESTLLGIMLFGAWRIRRVYREQLAAAPDRFTAAMRAVEIVVPRPLGKLITLELSLHRASLLFLTRRRDIPVHGHGIAYHRPLGVLLWAVLIITIIEMGAVHLAVPWPELRGVLFVCSVLGVWWLLAFSASLIVYPSTVDHQKLRIRFSGMVDITIPVGAVERVCVRNRSRGQRRIAMFSGDALHVEVSGSTNLAITLRDPVPVHLPKEGERLVRAVFLWADDPQKVVGLLHSGGHHDSLER